MRARNFVSPLSGLLALFFLAGCGRSRPQADLQARQDSLTNSDVASASSHPSSLVSIRTLNQASTTKIDVWRATLNSSLTRVSRSAESLQVNVVENHTDLPVEPNVAPVAETFLPAVALPPVRAGAAPGQSGSQKTRFYSRSGSRMTMEGTANMIQTHWRVQSGIIQGYLEAGPGFPAELDATALPARVEASASALIPVTSLKSLDADGKPFSDAFDNVMYEKLRAYQFKRIEYYLTELLLQQPPQAKDSSYLFAAKGQLVVEGVTNAISMPVTVLPLADHRLKLTGTTTVKMSSFGIKPIVVLSGQMKVGDELILSFEWLLGQR